MTSPMQKENLIIYKYHQLWEEMIVKNSQLSKLILKMTYELKSNKNHIGKIKKYPNQSTKITQNK